MGLEDALARTPTAERARVDEGAGALVGTRCRACGATAWPGRAVCHRCGSTELDDQAFTGTASLLSWTQVHVPRPGLEVPYVLGQVRLHEGPIVFGRIVGLDESVSLPSPVEARVGTDPDGRPVYWFEPG